MSRVERRPEVERSLALHREVALRLRQNPELLDRARERVQGWLRSGLVDRAWAEEWRRVLDGKPEEVAEILVEPSQRAHDLRQNSPFAGVLSPRTRWEILRRCSSDRVQS